METSLLSRARRRLFFSANGGISMLYPGLVPDRKTSWMVAEVQMYSCLVVTILMILLRNDVLQNR